MHPKNARNTQLSTGHLLNFSFSLALAASGLVACESLTGVKTPKLGPINSPSVTGDPCKNADWFEVGRIDGLTGVPLGGSLYAERCRTRGVPVNDELYTAGWQRGLIFYCTPDRGYDAGRAGESYAKVCPENLEKAFLERFNYGSKIAQLEKKNNELEQEVERRRLELVRRPAGSAPALEKELTSLRDALAKTDFEIRELERSNQSQQNITR